MKTRIAAATLSLASVMFLFAGTVLAEDGVDFARPAFEADAVQRLDAGIALRDVDDFE